MPSLDLEEEIKELKAKNETLKQKLQFLEESFDHFPESIWILSKNGDLLYATESLKNKLIALGWTPGQSIYAWLRSISPTAINKMVMKHDKLAMSSKLPLVFEETEHRLGKVFLSYKKGFKSSLNNQSYLLGVAVDITERKKAEGVIMERFNEMQTVEQTMRTFVENFRHDLKSPLSNIIGASDCLLNMPVDDETKVWVESIKLSGKHLLEYINQLTLGITKRKEPLPVNLSPVDLRKEIAVIEKSFQTMARAKNLTMRFTFSDDFPKYINLDAIRIRRIISNLVSNALKYTAEIKKNGYVEVETIYASEADSGLLEIHVRDTGIGIAHNYHEFIFSPLARVASNRPSDGSGLGLSIVKDFVEDLNGQVSVESQVGSGSTFSVTLPIIDIN